MKVLFILIASALALWPFNAELDKKLSSDVLQQTIVGLGIPDEEAKILASLYLERYPNLTINQFLADVQENKFNDFLASWKLNLFKDIISESHLIRAKSLPDIPISYELYKAFSTPFEEYMVESAKTIEMEKKLKGCPAGLSGSYHI